MMVCVCKGIRVDVVMNHETHQSFIIDQIPNTSLTQINMEAAREQDQQLFIKNLEL